MSAFGSTLLSIPLQNLTEQTDLIMDPADCLRRIVDAGFAFEQGRMDLEEWLQIFQESEKDLVDWPVLREELNTEKETEGAVGRSAWCRLPCYWQLSVL